MADTDLKARDKVEHQTPAESTRDMPVYVPTVDIYESEDALTLLVDMPGVGPENVTIDVRDNQLTLRGLVTPEGNNERVLLHEYGVGDYYRQFTLGRTIDQSKIEASVKDGVLALKLPKSDITRPRKIAVKVG